MTSEQKKLNSNQIEITVELGQEDLNDYVSKAENSLAQELEVDGFRKGKVPKDLVKKYIEPAKILEFAMEEALKGSLAQIIQEQKLDVIHTSDLNIKENQPNKLTYSVLLTTYPQIEISKLSDIKVEKKKAEVTQEEIEKTLNTIKTSRAVFKDKDGKAEKGDRVEIDFEASLEGRVIEGGVSKNHPVIVGSNVLIPGFEDELVGMANGEEKKFSLIAPADYYQKNIAGKKLDFTVKIENVKKVELPELNDEFAKTIGKFENLEALTANVKEGLAEEKKIRESQRVRLEILDRIIKDSDIHVPENLVSQQLDVMVENFDQDLHRNDMELSLYLAHIGKTQDDLKKDWKKDAERQVKIAFILHKISKDKNLYPSDKEVEESAANFVQSLVLKGDMDPKSLDVDAIKENIKSKVANEKALEFLEKTCSI